MGSGSSTGEGLGEDCQVHTVIVGAGQVGYHIASRLSLEHKDVVVIDVDGEAVRRVADQIDVQVVHGTGSDPAVLEAAGIRGDETIIPSGDSTILPGDRVFIFARRNTIPEIERILTVSWEGA